MLKNRITWSSVLVAFVLFNRFASAQGTSSTGLYQIVSGTFIACCGFAGEFREALPNERQSFIQLILDQKQNLATLSFLGKDRRTVFGVFSCETENPLPFRFEHGLIFPDHIVFRVDPGPPPNQTYWNYTVSNAPSSLRVDGMFGTVHHSCADLPDQFSHSNVVAHLVPPSPVIEGVEWQSGFVRFRFTGEPPNDYFVEVAETFPVTNWLTLTNVRVKLQPIEVIITDSLAQRPARFYRLRQQDCQCD